MVAVIPKVHPKKWTSILLGGKSVRVNAEYHSGGKGVAGRGGWHTGTDIAAPSGTSIRIPLGGVVVDAGWGAGGGSAFGNAVLVKLDTGDYMYFAHLSSIGVKVGRRLDPGDFIGKSGATGNVTGPHLHIEIRRGSSNGVWSRNESTFYEPISYLNSHLGKSIVPGGGPTGQANQSARGTGVGGDIGGTGGTPSGGGGGGGGGIGKVAFSKKDFYAKLESMFGDLDTLMDIDTQAVKEHGGKSIRWAIDEAVKQKLTDSDRFLSLLNQTAWFKKYGSETTKRIIEERSKPELFKTSVDQVQAAIEAEAANYGLVLSKGLSAQIARDAYVYQWAPNSAMVLDRLQAKATGKVSGGSIGEAYEKMDEMGYLFGVPVTEADRAQMRNDILDGRGQQGMLDRMQERSAQTYIPYADDIRKGTNLRTLIAPYLSVAQDLLEVSDASLDVDDPLFRNGKGFQMTDAKTGKVVVRPLSEFEEMVRRDPRWQTTQNAKDTAMKATNNLLQQMGLI